MPKGPTASRSLPSSGPPFAERISVPPPQELPLWPRLAELLVIALVYYATALLGNIFAIPPGSVTSVWLPSGVCLAAVLVRGHHIWPAIFLGAFLGNMWAYLDLGSSEAVVRAVIAGTCAGTGDVVCALLGARAVRHFAGTPYPFLRATQVGTFVLWGAVLAQLISPLFGVTSLALVGIVPWPQYLTTFATWWTGDAVGVLLATPVLLSFAYRVEVRPAPGLIQGALITVGLAVLVTLIMGLFPVLAAAPLPIFTLAPVLAWIVFRFNQREVFLTVAGVATVAVLTAYRHLGPFGGGEAPVSLIQLQWFLALMSVTVMVLASVVHERHVATQSLQRANEELEQRVADRTHELEHSLTELEREMQHRSQLERQLRQSYKMEAIGTLAGGIAHDFNNILMAMMGFTDLARQDAPEDSELARNLERVQRSQLRARDLVKRILLFARQGDDDVRAFDAAEVVAESLSMLRGSLPASIVLEHDLAPGVVVRMDPVQLQQVVVNLGTNSGRALGPNGGQLTVTLTSELHERPVVGFTETLLPGEYAQLTVADDGPGIPAEIQRRVFDPFFTTHDSDSTGMGLAVVLGIANAAGGTVRLTSEPGAGTIVTVFVPLCRDEVDQAHEPDDADASPPVSECSDGPVVGRARILCVDDEPALARMMKALLANLGYNVESFDDPVAALAHFEAHADCFDLVLTDLVMPAMSGRDLARAVKLRRPELPVVLCSGRRDQLADDELRSLGLAGVLIKPLTRDELSRGLRRAFEAATG